MFTANCLHCLCKVCSRSSCRYPCNVCFARCCKQPRSISFCGDFVHKPPRQLYAYRRRSPRARDYIKNMSVKDFLRLVGDLIDKEGD